MEFSGILNEIINNAKKDKKKIVLPESLDVRVLNACKICIEQDIADIILIGDEKLIKDTCNQNGIDIDFSKIKIENPLSSPLREKYINEFLSLDNPARELIINLVKKIYIYQDKRIDIIFTFKNTT